MLLILIIIVLLIIIFAFNEKQYNESEYAKHTHTSYSQAISNKGNSGEYKVAKVIGETNGMDKFVIHNLILKLKGRTSQIDHIIIQRNGIFIIETKNYAGWIFGYENAKKWSQTLAYGKVKNKFYNPIKQNRSHMYFLKRVLNEQNIFIPFVVFPKAKVLPNIQGVGYLSDLVKVLNGNTGIELSTDKILYLYKKLLKLKSSGDTLTQEHVYNVRKTLNDIDNNICPRCQNKLILRNGKYGKFYGCSNYPNCKFTKPIN